jgi:bifunctional DNA-binding transcriptional regulator/antitoxin component of YhaV-PrlF toxin-antitoxin module
MTITETIQVRERGVLTLPSGLRKRRGIKVGDTYQVIDFEGILVLTPLRPMVPELADEIERLRLEAGVSTETLLQGLREQRARYVAEHYGDEPDADTE